MIDEKKMSMQLRRIRGQVEGIEKMIVSGRECESVLTQISAAMSSLKTVARELLAAEASECHNSAKEQEKYSQLLKRFF